MSSAAGYLRPTQNVLRRGIVELGYGEPDPALLPVDLVAAAAAGVIDEFGPGAICYGQRNGPLPLRELIAARISERERCPATPADVFVTAGTSHGFDLVLGMLTRPGDAVLVESPTYGMALRTMRDRHLETVPLPLDEDGLDLDALEAAVLQLRAAGRRVPLLYTIPTFHNPAGVCLAAERRRRLIERAGELDFVVVEDDVYRELAYEGEAPPALWALDREAPIVRLGSFSKSLTPGLRVGWVNAPPALLARIDAAAVLDSGGSPTQFAACLVARLLQEDGFDGHVARLKAAYSVRRDALDGALREHAPAGCTWRLPAGGFFIWLELPEGVRSTELLPVAEAHGVSFAPGARFCADGADGAVRLSFSLLDEATIREGVRRLSAAIAAVRH
jgi:2-aminoadipate transaminase